MKRPEEFRPTETETAMTDREAQLCVYVLDDLLLLRGHIREGEYEQGVEIAKRMLETITHLEEMPRSQPREGLSGEVRKRVSDE